MPITIFLPAYLQRFADGRSELEIVGAAGTVGGALAALRAVYPGVHDRVVTERGDVRPHVNLFVGTERIRGGGVLDTPLAEGSELVILPAVSGG